MRESRDLAIRRSPCWTELSKIEPESRRGRKKRGVLRGEDCYVISRKTPFTSRRGVRKSSNSQRRYSQASAPVGKEVVIESVSRG